MSLLLLRGVVAWSFVGSAVATAPDPTDTVGTARWMAATLTWGALSTISTRVNGSTPGDAFGNPYSFADVKGVPYIYASDLDASMIDIFTAPGANPVASLALSEATLPNTGGPPAPRERKKERTPPSVAP